MILKLIIYHCHNSVGSLGKGNTEAAVEQVHVHDSTVFQALTGLRIKTWQVLYLIYMIYHTFNLVFGVIFLNYMYVCMYQWIQQRNLFYWSFLVQGGSGFARNITFERIRMFDLITPIVIDQSYGTLEVIVIVIVIVIKHYTL